MAAELDYLRKLGIFNTYGVGYITVVAAQCQENFQTLMDHQYCPEDLRRLLSKQDDIFDRLKIYTKLESGYVSRVRSDDENKTDAQAELDLLDNAHFLQYFRILKLSCMMLEYTGEILELALPAGQSYDRNWYFVCRKRNSTDTVDLWKHTSTLKMPEGYNIGIRLWMEALEQVLRKRDVDIHKTVDPLRVSVILNLLRRVLSTRQDQYHQRICPDEDFVYLTNGGEACRTMLERIEEQREIIQQKYWERGERRGDERDASPSEEGFWNFAIHILTSTRADFRTLHEHLVDRIEYITASDLTREWKVRGCRDSERRYWWILKMCNLTLVILTRKAVSLQEPRREIPDQFDILSAAHLLPSPEAMQYARDLDTMRVLDSLQLANDGTEFWETPEGFDWSNSDSVMEVCNRLEVAVVHGHGSKGPEGRQPGRPPSPEDGSP